LKKKNREEISPQKYEEIYKKEADEDQPYQFMYEAREKLEEGVRKLRALRVGEVRREIIAWWFQEKSLQEFESITIQGK
jgi:hypothetical protein